MGATYVGPTPTQDTDLVTKGYADTKVAAAAEYVAPGASVGYWSNLFLNFPALAGGAAPEPIMVTTHVSGADKRAFWLNENGSPRAASINQEPALKIFGPASFTSYTGTIFEILSRWDGASDTQRNVWSMRQDGTPLIGSGRTAAANVIVLSAAAAVPGGLPPGTVIIRTP